MSEALYCSPFVGWRGWRVYGGLLRSMHYPTTWQPGERLAAHCTRHDRLHPPDTVPAEECTCGIYAVEEHSTLRLNYLISPPIVVGRVSLWGRIVRHARGCRAQYAYPAVLFVENEALLEPLEAYGVPVIVGRAEDAA